MNLEKTALWLIMDPWIKTPYKNDLVEFPDLDKINLVILEKIEEYLPKLTHVCVSCPSTIIDREFKVIKKVDIYPPFKKFDNFENNYSNFLMYMRKNNLTDVVYCGFHYGDCIITKPDGAKYTSKKFNTFVKKDLCGFLPNKLNYDKFVLKYAKII